MDIWVRFIGLILFYQATASSPQHAIVPLYEAGDRFCQHNIMEHRPYIRVSMGNNQIVDDRTWPKAGTCTSGPPCAIYSIPAGTTLTIDGGFGARSAQQATQPISCLVPDFRTEGLVASATLHPDALTTRSSTDYVLPPGQLFAHQFKNDMIFVALRIPAPPGSPSSNVSVTATPRSGVAGNPRTLVVAPGTVIDIVNMPSAHAIMDYEIEPGPNDDIEELHGHFFVFHKLLDNPQGCRRVPNRGPENCGRVLRNHHRDAAFGMTIGLGCGSGRISAPGTN